MDSRRSDATSGPASSGDPGGSSPDDGGMPLAVKILVAGGFGVGKTTFVGAVSEIRPLQTEEVLTEQSVGVDDISGVDRKTTTTVAMDFGRLTIRDGLILYLFGTPGQDRFWFMWDELSHGALGAIVLADTRRLADCFPAVDYFENRGLPFIIGVNCFEDGYDYTDGEIREALDLNPRTPVVQCDARRRESAKSVLTSLVKYLIAVNDEQRAGHTAGQYG